MHRNTEIISIYKLSILLPHSTVRKGALAPGAEIQRASNLYYQLVFLFILAIDYFPGIFFFQGHSFFSFYLLKNILYIFVYFFIYLFFNVLETMFLKKSEAHKKFKEYSRIPSGKLDSPLNRKKQTKIKSGPLHDYVTQRYFYFVGNSLITGYMQSVNKLTDKETNIK